MTEKPNEKPKLELVDQPPPSVEDVAALDQDEQEYAACVAISPASPAPPLKASCPSP